MVSWWLTFTYGENWITLRTKIEKINIEEILVYSFSFPIKEQGESHGLLREPYIYLLCSGSFQLKFETNDSIRIGFKYKIRIRI